VKLARLAYALLFCLVLPALLALWAHATAPIVPLPVPAAPRLGAALAVVGLLAILAGWRGLWVHGGGLPMNAFPPPRRASRGIYRWIAHPIYAGFTVACAGVALASGSASGLWLVTPLVALGCAALVAGHERHDLERRLGPAPSRPLLALPAGDDRRPGAADVLSIYALVFLPWLVLYEAVVALGPAADALASTLGPEGRLPVVEWSELIYASAYPFAAAAPLAARTRRDLRTFAWRGLTATALGIALFFLVPLATPARPFTPSTVAGRLLSLERLHDPPGVAAFPAFHVLWAFLAASLYGTRGRRWRAAAALWAAAIAASCVATGMHSLADVAGAGLIFLLAVRAPALWEVLRRSAERIANSWRQWQVGPLRILSHSAYAFAAAVCGALVVGTLAGREGLAAAAVSGLAGLLGAALWAQTVEGSPRLLRPFGYYGFLAGAAAGTALAPLLGASPLRLLAAWSVAAPWVQAIGRLRCLAQGCCHGRPAPERLGIRYVHPSSRVTRMTAWAGLPLHPAPLYSILANVAIGLLLARLWSLHAALSLIAGLYLILAGLARFVEEAYRGEPQTPRRGGLALYQWLAIASCLAGIALTTLPLDAAAPAPAPSWATLPAALALGLATAAAMGVDFPASSRRFARLSG
jgi:protein-S-isoprenylcysteine O-methyltransferase Ste14